MGYDAVFDKMKDECGVFGIWAFGQSDEAANFTYLGLHALQHRGQESAGIVATDGESLHVHRDMGLVADIFGAEVLERLKGGAAIGHVRYSTTGGSHVKNAQPVAVQYAGGAVAVAHNGNLVNAEALRADLEAQGSIFTASSDTEVIVHLLARSCPVGTPGTPEYLVSSIRQALGKVAGAYSLLFLTPRALVGVRDPMGFRPLVVWKIEPCASSSVRSASALTRLPLWATATAPPAYCTATGWAFFTCDAPVVEYRTWPMAAPPLSRSRTGAVKMSATSPMSRWTWSVSPSVATIPADSWPRCCSAWRPR